LTKTAMLIRHVEVQQTLDFLSSYGKALDNEVFIFLSWLYKSSWTNTTFISSPGNELWYQKTNQ